MQFYNLFGGLGAVMPYMLFRAVYPFRLRMSLLTCSLHFLFKVYLEIRCPDGGDGGRRENISATHEEIHPTGILSVIANLTPWSNHNQSPRNMYQCQVHPKFLFVESPPLVLAAYYLLFSYKPMCNLFPIFAQV